MKNEKEVFEMANDLDFYIAIDEAIQRSRPGQTNPMKTIGDRVRLIRELEKKGFEIRKVGI